MRDSMKLSDRVYDALRRDILATRIRPGEKLSEAQLAARYGVSRAPVRDALSRLEQDNLVVVRPQIGTIVSPISEDAIMNILEVRMLLEPEAARKAAGNLTEDDRETLSRHFERLAQLEPGSETKKRALFETDGLLHSVIWERCGNPAIKRILDGYRGAIQRIRLSNAEFGNRLEPSEQEIRAIFSALHRGDGAESARAIAQHLENIGKALRSIFASMPTATQARTPAMARSS
jgi:DNA-binding GntR family transcriptional regulator